MHYKELFKYLKENNCYEVFLDDIDLIELGNINYNCLPNLVDIIESYLVLEKCIGRYTISKNNFSESDLNKNIRNYEIDSILCKLYNYEIIRELIFNCVYFYCSNRANIKSDKVITSLNMPYLSILKVCRDLYEENNILNHYCSIEKVGDKLYNIYVSKDNVDKDDYTKRLILLNKI